MFHHPGNFRADFFRREVRPFKDEIQNVLVGPYVKTFRVGRDHLRALGMGLMKISAYVDERGAVILVHVRGDFRFLGFPFRRRKYPAFSWQPVDSSKTGNKTNLMWFDPVELEIRVAFVFPVPRGPENKMAWATRSDEMAFASVRVM